MLKIILLSLLGIVFLISSILWFVLVNPTPFIPHSRNEPLDIVENLKSHVTFLTSIQPSRSFYNIESLNKSSEYIKEQFEKSGCLTRFQEFKVEQNAYKNIICSFRPSEESRIIVGAHYDVDENTPGADDNASGVAGLIELAKLVGSNEENLDSGLDFVAYPNEELPSFRTKNMGSAVHARSLKEKNTTVKYTLVLEMIGYFSDEEGSQKFPHPLLKAFYPTKGDFIAVIGRPKDWTLTRNVKNSISRSNIPVQSINAPRFIPGIDFSDHLNYWNEGYSAVMISDTAFYRNPNYHRNTDTANTLDYEKMSRVVQGLYHHLIGSN